MVITLRLVEGDQPFGYFMLSTPIFCVAFMGGADVAEGAFQGFVFNGSDFFGVLADVIADYFDDLIHVLVSLNGH